MSSSHFQPPSYEETYAPSVASANTEPSAPFFALDDQLSSQLSYDQVVLWWNSLPEEKRLAMKAQGEKLHPSDLANLRTDYQPYYPKEYYPKKIYTQNEVSASDYYLLFHYRVRLIANCNWYNSSMSEAFAPLEPPAYEDLPPPSYDEATNWWRSLSPNQRAEIERQGDRLNSTQRNTIRLKFVNYNYYPQYYPLYRYEFSPYDYYLMNRYPTYLDYYVFDAAFRTSLNVTGMLVRGVVDTVSYVGSGLTSAAKGAVHFTGAIGHNLLSGSSSSSSSSSSSNSGDSKLGAFLLGLLVILGIIATAASALVASAYTAVKGAASFLNLAQGKKIGRSLFRLACIAGGAYGGVIGGAVIGAMVGSAVPGVGTAIGAIVGAIFGAPISAALGAAFAKYSLQALSWFRHKDDPLVISATHPDKWPVEKTVANLAEKGVTMTTEQVKTILTKVRTAKNEISSFGGSIPGTTKHEEKEKYNHFREAVVGGKDPRQLLRVDAHTCLLWNEREQQLITQDLPLPALKSGLKI